MRFVSSAKRDVTTKRGANISTSVANVQPASRCATDVGARRREQLKPLRAALVLVLLAGAIGGVNFLFGLIIARAAGQREWSAIAPLSATGTAGSFFGLGLEYAVARATVSGSSAAAILRQTRVLLGGLLAVVIGSIALADPLAVFLHLYTPALIPLSALLFATTVASAAPSGLLVGQGRLVSLGTLGGAGALVRLGIVWLIPGNWVFRVLTASIAAVIVTSALMLLAARHGRSVSEASAMPISRLVFAGASVQLSLWLFAIIPTVLGRHYLNPQQAGELSTVIFVCSGIAFLAAPIATAYYPLLVREPFGRRFRDGMALSIAIVVLSSAAIVFIGPTLFQILYRHAEPHLRLLLALGGAAVLAQAVASFSTWAVIARGGSLKGVALALAIAIPLSAIAWWWHYSSSVLLLSTIPSMVALAGGTLIFGRRGRTTRPSTSKGELT